MLLTLTTPRNGGDLEARRERLLKAWARWRTWLHSVIGRFAFVGLPELTPGADGSGHVHAHFVCVWPWWDWRRAPDSWRRAIGDAGALPPDIRVVKARKLRGSRSDAARSAATAAASYVAKYATKGVDLRAPGMTAELVGEWVAASYGKRRWTTSEGWWLPAWYDKRGARPIDPPKCCRVCGKVPVVEERPEAFSLAASAMWKSVVLLRRGQWGEKNAVQLELDIAQVLR